MANESAPTLEDVARLAGVSTATVSRCFNAPGRVIPATRERVMRVVDELGYTPHFGGRALASRRADTIGAIIPTMDNAIFARGLQAFQEGLAEAGVTMLVASSGYDTEREFRQIQNLISRGADGLLLIGKARAQAAYDFLRRRRIPYVIAWSYHADDEDCYVGFDNVTAMRALARRVLDHGHRDVAMIAGRTDNNDRAADRIDGVRKALAGAGLDPDRMPLIETDYALESGAAAFARLMTSTPRPTAVICGNDVLAVGAIVKARAMNLAVPGDVSITGFDDIELAKVVTPALTTVHVPHRRMGHAAARLLLDLRDGKVQHRSIELDTLVVERDSLGPAAKTEPHER